MDGYRTATALINLMVQDDKEGAALLLQAWETEEGVQAYPTLIIGMVKAATATHYYVTAQATGEPPSTDEGRHFFQALSHMANHSHAE